jgi:cytochrome c-type biogenesis protein CcmH/NrfG
VDALGGWDTSSATELLRGALEDPSPGVRARAARAALRGWRRVQADPDLLRAILPVLAAEAAAVPEDDVRWFRLGAAYEIAGDLEGAIDAYARKVALDPFAHTLRSYVEELRARVEAAGER